MDINMRFLVLLFLGWIQTAQAIPEIQHWQTEQGTKVYFISAMELPIVDIQISFDAGSVRDNGKYGLASLTSSMLNEGADNLTAEQLAEVFDNVGAQCSQSTSKEMTTIQLRSLTEQTLFEPAFENMLKILKKPAFPAKELERVRKQMLQSVEAQKQSPSSLLNKAFYETLYGEHPYAFQTGGTEESLPTLTREEVIDFYKKHYVAKNMIVSLIGAISREQAEAIVNRILKDLPIGETLPPIPVVSDTYPLKPIHIEHPSEQTHIILGQIGYARNDKDYFPMVIANYVLGGGSLVSRLPEEVREKHGLAYSVHSSVYPMLQAGTISASLQTRQENATKAIDLVKNVIQSFVDKGMTQEELIAAKKHLTGNFALRIDSNGKLLQYLSTIGFYNLPLDYMQTWSSKIEAISLEEVNAAIKRQLKPEKMVLMTVGKSISQ
jgi:zinc protease